MSHYINKCLTQFKKENCQNCGDSFASMICIISLRIHSKHRCCHLCLYQNNVTICILVQEDSEPRLKRASSRFIILSIFILFIPEAGTMLTIFKQPDFHFPISSSSPTHRSSNIIFTPMRTHQNFKWQTDDKEFHLSICFDSLSFKIKYSHQCDPFQVASCELTGR